jgi:hypothetical protein
MKPTLWKARKGLHCSVARIATTTPLSLLRGHSDGKLRGEILMNYFGN